MFQLVPVMVIIVSLREINRAHGLGIWVALSNAVVKVTVLHGSISIALSLFTQEGLRAVEAIKLTLIGELAVDRHICVGMCEVNFAFGLLFRPAH